MASTISDHQQLKCTSMEIASDKLTEGGSSHLMEATQPMEISSAIAYTFPTKRKAESDPAEEIEESGDEGEESGDENEESSDEEIDWATKQRSYVEEVNAYNRSKWITPEWDVDSFENLKFDEEKEEACTENMKKKEDVQDWLRFRRQHIENKGFYVDPELWPMYDYTDYRVINDLEKSVLGQTYSEFFKELACLCVQRFNQDKKEEEEKEKDEDFLNLEFVRVVGGVVKMTGRPKSHITFMAREKPDGPDVEYQAKVWSEPVKGITSNYLKHHPILCRPAPPPKTSN